MSAIFKEAFLKFKSNTEKHSNKLHPKEIKTRIYELDFISYCRTF